MNQPYRSGMEDHLKITAWLQIASGALLILVAVFIGTILSVVGIGSGDGETAGILAGISGVLGLFFGMLALPSFLGGWGLLKRKSWARVLVIILSVLHLFNFPLGTLIGGYSLWVLLNDDTRRLLEGGHAYPRVPGY
jgi:hypothetical protein